MSSASTSSRNAPGAQAGAPGLASTATSQQQLMPQGGPGPRPVPILTNGVPGGAAGSPASIIPLVLQSGAVVAPDMNYTVVLDMLHSSTSANAEASINGGVVLSVSSPQGPASLVDLTLGQLNFKRLLACARNKLWWMTPEWRTDTWALPPETQFLLAEMAEGGPYALLLPLIDGDFRATLRPAASKAKGANGEVVIRLESGSATVKGSHWPAAAYIAASWDPYELIDRGVAAAAALSGGARPRSTKEMPSSLDGFGWCTWDAFYSTVSARGLAEGLTALEAGGVSPQLLIIDDGWQLTDIDANARKTPATELADVLHVEGEPRRLLEATQDEFYYESQEVMADTAAHLPPGTSAGTVMPTLANLGPQHNAPIHTTTHSGSLDAIDMASMDNPTASLLSGAAAAASAAAAAAQAAARDAPAKIAAGIRSKANSSSGAPPPADGTAADPSKPTTQNTTSTKLAPGPPPKPVALSSTDAAPSPSPPAAVNGSNATDNTNSSSSAASSGVSSSFLAIWLARVYQKVTGWLMGIMTAGILIFYQWVVEPAPANSLTVRAFTYLVTKGALRGAMLSFYASASDFTRRLTSVRANGKFSSPDAGPDADWEGVPEALGTVVAHIKRKFGVRYIYCWHGLPGYWAGVMPAQEGQKEQQGAAAGPSCAVPGGGCAGVPGLESRVYYASPTPGVLEVEPSMGWNPAVLAGIGVVTDPSRLYHAMHRYLADSGVDGVKVDCQAGVGLIGSAMGGGAALSATYQAALEGSVARHFRGNHAINCMCHSTENLYRMTATAIARASDDFYPRDPASSHPHIAACAYNSVFLGALLQPDWDMFHSKHPAAHLHAAARAVSGGPVYVSDKPGEHDFALLHALVLPDGSVLRCLQPGRPTRDCLFHDVLRDGKSLLKVWNLNPVTGVVGVFHLQGSSWDRTRRKFHVHDKAPKPLTTMVRPYDVDAFRPAATAATAAAGPAALGPAAADEFATMARGSGRIMLQRGHEGVPVTLNCGQADVVFVSRVLRSGSVAFAPLGLANMINGGGAVRSVTLATGRHTPSVVTGGGAAASSGVVAGGFGAKETSFSVQVRGYGDLIMYCSREPDVVLLNGARLQPGVSYMYGEGAGAAARALMSPSSEGQPGDSGRLLVDLPRVSDLDNEVTVVFRSFD